jgi:hypothetical protein
VAGKANPPASWVRLNPRGSSSRASARLGDNPLQHGLVHPCRQDRLQQRPCITATQGLDVKLRQTGERVAQLSCREHDCDPLGQETARHKREGPRGRTIKPLRVINHTYQWLLFSRLGQQAEDRQSDEEPIRSGVGGRVGGPLNQSKRDAKRGVLRLRQPLHELEHRCAQLLKRGEGQFHLGLDPERAGDLKSPGSLDRVLEQRGLPDTCFAMHHQHPATPASHAIQQSVERLTLVFPAEQLGL